MNCDKPPLKTTYLDQMQLVSRQYGEIVCTPLSSSETNVRTGDDVLSLQASTPFGTMQFHEMAYDDYTIWHNHYKIQEDTNLEISINSSFLGLHFSLKNNAHYTVNQFRKGIIPRYHYNFTYIPRIQCEYSFRKSEEYAFFSIHFTPAYLQQCSTSFPALSTFLDNIALKKSISLNNIHPPATPEMILTIQDIIYCSFTGEQKKMYLEAKVSELLLLSLLQASVGNYTTDTSFHQYDIKKIQDARDYLLQHPYTPYSLEELAHMVGTNDFKLKRGFKQLYGTTVHGFILEERMQKARKLLLESSMSIKKIATTSGYRNLSNFTAAFKKRFGFPPSTLRQTREGA